MRRMVTNHSPKVLRLSFGLLPLAVVLLVASACSSTDTESVDGAAVDDDVDASYNYTVKVQIDQDGIDSLNKQGLQVGFVRAWQVEGAASMYVLGSRMDPAPETVIELGDADQQVWVSETPFSAGEVPELTGETYAANGKAFYLADGELIEDLGQETDGVMVVIPKGAPEDGRKTIGLESDMSVNESGSTGLVGAAPVLPSQDDEVKVTMMLEPAVYLFVAKDLPESGALLESLPSGANRFDLQEYLTVSVRYDDSTGQFVSVQD